MPAASREWQQETGGIRTSRPAIVKMKAVHLYSCDCDSGDKQAVASMVAPTHDCVQVETSESTSADARLMHADRRSTGAANQCVCVCQVVGISSGVIVSTGCRLRQPWLEILTTGPIATPPPRFTCVAATISLVALVMSSFAFTAPT